MIGPKGNRPKPDEQAAKNGFLVRDLANNARYGGNSVGRTPRFLRDVLEADAWRHYADPDLWHQVDYGPDDFDKFAKAKWPAGLDVADGLNGLIKICDAVGGEDAVVAARLLRGKMSEEPRKEIGEGKAGPGRGKKTSDNVTRLPERGNSDAYALRRLKRDRPDLAERVVAGEISAHKAAVEAGFRQYTVQIAPTVEGFAAAIRRHLTPAEAATLKESL